MREGDANKLSQSLQVPLQELDVGPSLLMHGWVKNRRIDVTSAALLSSDACSARLLPSKLRRRSPAANSIAIGSLRRPTQAGWGP
jgi:hypothetical protein